MSICAFHFYIIYFHFFLGRSWHSSNFWWHFDHLKPQNALALWGIEGPSPLRYRMSNCFSLCLFPDATAGVYQILCQLVHTFGNYSRFVNFWPPKTPQNAHWGIEGLIVFSLCPFPDESTGVYQILCKLVHPFGSYSRFLHCWPLKPPKSP